MALTGCAARAQGVTVTFYDMGKADAALITAEDGSRILIDAGTNKGGKKLAERFAEEGIERLDAMIITHFDKDHVGGADKILESVSVAPKPSERFCPPGANGRRRSARRGFA